MMIRWCDESIRLMVDSLEYTAFATEQCKQLLPHLKPTDTVLEAGSGIGYLTRAIAKHVNKVISVEFDPTASAHLQKCVAEEGLTNIRAENADAFTFDPKERVDVLVCCRFGSMEEILSMMPGMGNLKNVKIDEKAMGRTEAIILSMTPYERENPSCLNHSRKRRIAAGSGVKVEEINKLLKSFDAMNAMIKQFSGPGAAKKMKKLQRMGGFPGM
ncbi:MAG: methyltransferase domain-containing protein, partial [Oscillospiraceae bacterium]|nr:methyltransferase domain-containing protein [Oscillospiraceae bacterium]